MTNTPEQSRWTDSPFRQPGLSPEQLEWLDLTPKLVSLAGRVPP